MEQQETERVMELLCDAFPWQELQAPTVVVWMTVLAPLDGPPAEAAVWDLIRTEDRFPSVAAFLAAYRPRKAEHDERSEWGRLRLVEPTEPEPVEPAAPPPPEFRAMLARFQRHVAIPQEG